MTSLEHFLSALAMDCHNIENIESASFNDTIRLVDHRPGIVGFFYEGAFQETKLDFGVV
jgi:hypothetical protein